MSDTSHFLRVLKVELEDLMEDIRRRIHLSDLRFLRDDITHYVHEENVALLNREIDALSNLVNVVDGIDAAIYKDVDEVEAALLEESKSLVARMEDPEAIYIQLKRKMRKVRMFLSSDATESMS